MFCPRLDHFVRLNQDGSVGKCGHMIRGKGFESFEALEHSGWLNNIRDKMSKDEWPAECIRCEQSEKTKGESIRTNSITCATVLASHVTKDSAQRSEVSVRKTTHV